ncbi:MAG: BCD family MFS transporter [Gammaproteobacteria bacterium]
MSAANDKLPLERVSFWSRVGRDLLPFADAASDDLPLSRLIRLALFQVSVGMAVVLLTGTINRVMIVEMGISSAMVALMVALPLLFAPFRALIGFRSDVYRSHLGWRRVPFIWVGTLLQFGGLAIMPFALILLSGDSMSAPWIGQLGAALAFLLVGAGLHTTQTAGLALATDLAPEKDRPQVVALLFVMLLIGMLISALLLGALLENFSQMRLIRVIQGAAVLTFALNMVALWKQEARAPSRTQSDEPTPKFRDAWVSFRRHPASLRLLVAVSLGTLGFTMQDILLEPYGAQVLGLSVSGTTMLTALLAFGTLTAFVVAARQLNQGLDANRLAGYGAMFGVFAFGVIALTAGVQSALLFRIGVTLIGFAAGLFAVGTMVASMELARESDSGLALGAWGAVQATSAGCAIALGGLVRDGVATLAERGALGPGLVSEATGYGAVYYIEIALLFVTLVVIGPLARHAGTPGEEGSGLGLAEMPN